ncbi:Non-structural protein ORF4b [Bienertia sinuspersici]
MLLKPQFIQFISQDSYAGLANENPFDHLSRFLEKCDILKLTNVSSDAIRLRLFPFSLRDDAKEWLNDEGANKYTTWNSLAKAFLLKFFSQKKNSKLRNDILHFAKMKMSVCMMLGRGSSGYKDNGLTTDFRIGS